MAERSKARTVFGRSNNAIVGSNPNGGMDVYPQFPVFLFSCVQVEALSRADPPTKEPCQLSKLIHNFQKNKF
jgi:hypothetical protein